MSIEEESETVFASDVDDRWIIDHREYLGLVGVLVRARAVVRSYRKNGDGSVRVPPRAAGDLRACLKEFAAIDQARRIPCRITK